MMDGAIVFDVDGTLIDSVDQVICSIQVALKKVNAKTRSDEEIAALLGPGADEILKKLIGEERTAKDAFEFYIESQRELVHDMKVYDGIYDLLEELNAKKIPCGIVTGRHAWDLEIVLNAFQLKKHFAVIISDDQLKLPKPSPEGLQLAGAQMGTPMQKIFYVGDAEGDVQTAHKTGAKAIAALWDRHVEKEKLQKEKPEYMAEGPLDILQLIKRREKFQAELSL